MRFGNHRSVHRGSGQIKTPLVSREIKRSVDPLYNRATTATTTSRSRRDEGISTVHSKLIKLVSRHYILLDLPKCSKVLSTCTAEGQRGCMYIRPCAMTLPRDRWKAKRQTNPSHDIVDSYSPPPNAEPIVDRFDGSAAAARVRLDAGRFCDEPLPSARPSSPQSYIYTSRSNGLVQSVRREI